MTLSELHKVYQQEASKLGDYASMSKTDLANGYCDAEDKEFAASDAGDAATAASWNSVKSQYMAALMLRYWFKIIKWTNDSASLNLQPEDYCGWLVDALNSGKDSAFFYRAWRDQYKAHYRYGRFVEWQLDENGEKILNPYWYQVDDTAVDKIINRCCYSIRNLHYQVQNKQKRKDDGRNASLDEMIEADGDFATACANAYVIDEPITSPISELIRTFIKRGEVMEALVVDGIAYGNTFKSEKETTVFNPRMLVQHLNKLDKSYLESFCNKYKCDTSAFIDPKAEKTKLQRMDNSKLYRCVEKTLLEIRQDETLLSCLSV